MSSAVATADERVERVGWLHRFVARPEVGALTGAAAVFVFFASYAPVIMQPHSLATLLYGASTIGIMTVAVSLLMIGGEFDLSAGVMVTTASLVGGIVNFEFSTNVWIGVGASLLVCLGIGAANGLMLVRTGLPSFIVTLGMFMMLTGANLAVTRLVTGNVATSPIADLDGFSSAKAIFAAEIPLGVASVKITVFFWLALVALATWMLFRTRAGNWIFAVGGQSPSARAVGVPVKGTKIMLFMGVGLMAWLLGMHNLFYFDSIQSGQGVGNELIYIAASVVGGCLLTGGFGSAVGAATGALVFGIVQSGIVYAQWNADWFKFFLGLMLVLATLVNAWMRRRVEVTK
jgi:simple sugar transport system permease protein